MNFKNIPIEFIEKSLTGYQKQTLIMQYDIFTNAEKATNKFDSFKRMSKKYNIDFGTAKNIYYKIKSVIL